MSQDLSHLNAIQLRLSHERARLAAAKTEREREFRRLQVSSAEKELAGERKFLGLEEEPVPPIMNRDALLAELDDLQTQLGL